jgi:plasmid maintenance system antidote protein VapI
MPAGQPFSDALRGAIAESGLAHSTIEKQTAVKRASIMRFMRGERSLRLDIADRLAAFFGLTVKAERKGKVKRGVGL